ncbi:MAG: hypothetical protein F4Z18_02415 [Caldilineaceae bacterium SB0666_bin_21]|nr:hypothetical protein [Caldilineaceae bacterium SB0666_bin_21]
MPKAGGQTIQTVPAGFLYVDPAVKPTSPKDLENRGMGAGARAWHHELDRLAPLPGQQPLGIGSEGGRLVAAREQGLKVVQVGLQPEQVLSGQLQGRERDGDRGGTPGTESGSFNLSHDFS